jgi:hypothetical protein
MIHRAALFVAAVVALAAGAVSDTAAHPTGAPATSGIVARVVDGDTIVLSNGARVRLVQIDTPEVGTGECFSRAAGRELRAMLPTGAAVTLVADGRLDRVDRATDASCGTSSATDGTSTWSWYGAAPRPSGSTTATAGATPRNSSSQRPQHAAHAAGSGAPARLRSGTRSGRRAPAWGRSHARRRSDRSRRRWV